MITASILKRLTDLKLPGEALHVVLTILAEVQCADDARRAAEAMRSQRYRQRGGGAIPEELRRQVFARDGYACVYCGSKENLQCDHIQPVSREGPTTLENLAAACRTCNARKRDRERKQDGRRTEIPRNSSELAPPHPLKKENKIPEPRGSGPTHAELERELFRRGRQVCGKSSGGLINSLLKAKQHDVALARSVVETASTKNDPREFVAAATRSTGNGARNPTMAAFDDLISRAEGGEVAGDSDFVDVTPGRS